MKFYICEKVIIFLSLFVLLLHSVKSDELSESKTAHNDEEVAATGKVENTPVVAKEDTENVINTSDTEIKTNTADTEDTKISDENVMKEDATTNENVVNNEVDDSLKKDSESNNTVREIETETDHAESDNKIDNDHNAVATSGTNSIPSESVQKETSDVVNNEAGNKTETLGNNSENIIPTADENAQNTAVAEKETAPSDNNANSKSILNDISEMSNNEIDTDTSPARTESRQIAHVSGHRGYQSPLGSLTRIFGGIGRTVTGGLQGNTNAIGRGSASGPQPESDLERVQRLSKGFERLIQFVNIMGQVDSFLSERTRSMLKRISFLADSEEDGRRRRRSRYHHY